MLKYNTIFGEEKTIRLINQLIENLDDLEYIQALEGFKKILHRTNLKYQIKEMLENGEQINDIAKKLGILYDEVINILTGKIDINVKDER